MIYLDSAATSFYRPPQVADAVAEAIRTMGNGSRGVYQTALQSARVIFETRQLIDRLFDGYGPEQVVFTANSTESLNMAIKGCIKPGDRGVTTVMEHNSVLRPLYQMEELGAELTVVGCMGAGETGDGSWGMCGERLRRKGLLDMEALHRAIRPGVKAVVCTHASNLTGNVLDIRTIGRWCRKAGVLFLVDASQTAGIFPISMKEDGIDILCFTGHKGLLGPQGTGGMCIRPGIVLEPLLTGGSGIQTFSRRHPAQLPTALEAGTLNGHGIAGLRAGLRWIEENGGVDPIRQKEQELAKEFYRSVRDIPGIRFYGDYTAYEENDQPLAGKPDRNADRTLDELDESWSNESRLQQHSRAAMVTLNLGEEDSAEVSDWLSEEHEIDTRAGGHCAPLMHEALGTREQGAVRFSFSSFNTIEQIRQAARALWEY